MSLEKDKLVKRLETYKASLVDRMAAPLPSKHLHRESQYREYLVRELTSVQSELDGLKLEGLK